MSAETNDDSCAGAGIAEGSGTAEVAGIAQVTEGEGVAAEVVDLAKIAEIAEISDKEIAAPQRPETGVAEVAAAGEDFADQVPTGPTRQNPRFHEFQGLRVLIVKREKCHLCDCKYDCKQSRCKM